VANLPSLPASWAPSGKDSGGAPQLKGARWFSYDELKKCTNNFSDSNEIGSGGYGKVNFPVFNLFFYIFSDHPSI
jgi:hypothetical protein